MAGEDWSVASRVGVLLLQEVMTASETGWAAHMQHVSVVFLCQEVSNLGGLLSWIVLTASNTLLT